MADRVELFLMPVPTESYENRSDPELIMLALACLLDDSTPTRAILRLELSRRAGFEMRARSFRA